MRRELIICLLLTGLVLGAYYPASHLGFLNYDDPDYVTSNPMVGGGLTWESVWWALTNSHDGNWHPVTWWSHMLDCQIFGLNPAGPHCVNIGWHIINTLILFLVLRKMTEAVWRSALVAALFALHPMHIQSVAWITERKDVLSGFFMLMTLWAYTQHAQQRQDETSEGTIAYSFPALSTFLLPSARPLQLALLFFALGLMSKPMLVTLPAILLLLDFWPLNRATGLVHIRQCFQSSICKKLLLEKIPFFALSLATVMATLSSQKGAGFVITTDMLPLSERITNIPVFYMAYMEKLFWPENLAIFYPYQAISFWERAVALLLLVLLTVVCFRRLCFQPYWLVGWLWFLIMLLPVIGIVQVGGQSIADRYTYLPAIGPFIIVAWVLGELATISGRWLAGATVAGLVTVLACMLDTIQQIKYWQDDITLFKHALDVTKKNNSSCYFSLGCALWHSGDLDGAVRNFREALQVEPKYKWELNPLMVHHNLGCVFLALGKPAEAEIQFKAALPLEPQIAFAHKYLGDALSEQGKEAEAEVEFTTALQLEPGNPLLFQKIEASRTLAKLCATLKTQVTPETLVQIAEIQTILEQFQPAAGHYSDALKLKPDDSEILNNMAWLLATCPDQKVRDGNQAVKLAKYACELTGWQKTVYLGTLGAAYAEAGKFDEAIATAQRACALAIKNGETDIMQRNQELLGLYRAHKPVRD
jgi:tetratricopeptide (TPR) repeat protein